MLSLELIVHDSLHQATLSDSGIPNDNELKQVILRCEGSIVEDLVTHFLDVLQCRSTSSSSSLAVH